MTATSDLIASLVRRTESELRRYTFAEFEAEYAKTYGVERAERETGGASRDSSEARSNKPLGATFSRSKV